MYAIVCHPKSISQNVEVKKKDGNFNRQRSTKVTGLQDLPYNLVPVLHSLKSSSSDLQTPGLSSWGSSGSCQWLPRRSRR